MQTKEELEHWYAVSDPWLYRQTLDDQIRKDLILDFLPLKYQRALDIGCGEGFVTTDLPAIDIHGIENHKFETIIELEGIDRKQLEYIESSFIQAVKETGKSLNIKG